MLLLPPAPAALVLEGRVLATLSALSAAAFLLIAVAGPPGGFGDAGRAVVVPVVACEFTGDCGRGDDCRRIIVLVFVGCSWFPHSARMRVPFPRRGFCSPCTYHLEIVTRNSFVV